MTATSSATAHVLLRAGHVAPVPLAVLSWLNTHLASHGVALRIASSDGEATVMEGCNLRLTLRDCDAPLSPDLLSTALWAPIVALKPGDLAATVASHGRHIAISVEGGVLATCLATLHHAVLAMSQSTEPVLVHWGPSDMLYRPDEVMATRHMSLPIPLCLHPVPLFAHEAPLNPGFVALGSERFCGRIVVMMPSPLPLAQSLDLVARLLRNCMAGLITLEDGQTVADDDAGLVHIVATPPDDGAPLGRLLLGLGRVPKIDEVQTLDMGHRPAPTAPKAASHDRALAGHARPAFMSTGNVLMLAAGIVTYAAISQSIGLWFNAQSEQVRATLTSPAPVQLQLLASDSE